MGGCLCVRRVQGDVAPDLGGPYLGGQELMRHLGAEPLGGVDGVHARLGGYPPRRGHPSAAAASVHAVTRHLQGNGRNTGAG